MNAPALSFDPAHTAVLSMDMQTGIIALYTQGEPDMPARAGLVLQQARRAGLSVIHVQLVFRPGLPEVNPRNLLFSAIKASPQHQQLFVGPLSALHPAVAPAAADIVITKCRGSAFTGTDLDIILRAQGVDTLVLFGIATSGVVLATLLHAADADYRLVVIKDCCADLNAQVHACLIEQYFPRLAAVITAADFAAALPAAPPSSSPNAQTTS